MKTPRLLNLSALASLALLAAITIVGYAILPADAQMPVHWGPDGAADFHMARNWALLVPVAVILFIGVAFQIVLQRGLHGERAAPSLRTAFAGLALLMAALQAGAIAITLGFALDMVRLVVFALGVLLIVLGNILPKSQPNAFAGMRLPWTLDDPANWQATNRLSGILMMVGGFAMALAALLIGDKAWLFAITALGIVGPLLAGILFSYRLSRQGRV